MERDCSLEGLTNSFLEARFSQDQERLGSLLTDDVWTTFKYIQYLFSSNHQQYGYHGRRKAVQCIRDKLYFDQKVEELSKEVRPDGTYKVTYHAVSKNGGKVEVCEKGSLGFEGKKISELVIYKIKW